MLAWGYRRGDRMGVSQQLLTTGIGDSVTADDGCSLGFVDPRPNPSPSVPLRRTASGSDARRDRGRRSEVSGQRSERWKTSKPHNQRLEVGGELRATASIHIILTLEFLHEQRNHTKCRSPRR